MPEPNPPAADPRKKVPMPEGPIGAFDHWCSIAKHNKPRSLSQASVDKYRPLWLAFCGWMAQRAIDWRELDADQVQAFLDGPTPSTRTNRTALSSNHMAPATRNRYWRLIYGVYAEAALQNWIEQSPCEDLTTPTLGKAERKPQVLPPRALAALRDPETVRSLLPQDSPDHWWVLRDRALIALLAHTGIATAEICALTGKSICRDQKPVIGTRQMLPSNALSGDKGLFKDAPGLKLHIPASRDYVKREIALDVAVMTHLGPWLACRQRLLAERSAHQVDLSKRSTYMQAHAVDGPIFLSRKAGGMDKDLPPMAVSSVYVSVRNVLRDLYRPDKQGITRIPSPPEGVHVAAGAAIVRNSVLKAWCEEEGRVETMKRAGLKTSDTLSHWKDADQNKASDLTPHGHEQAEKAAA